MDTALCELSNADLHPGGYWLRVLYKKENLTNIRHKHRVIYSRSLRKQCSREWLYINLLLQE